MQDRLDTAARIAACDETIQARTGENASIFTPLLRSRLDPLRAAITGDERTRIAREVAVLDEASGFKLAFGEAT